METRRLRQQACVQIWHLERQRKNMEDRQGLKILWNLYGMREKISVAEQEPVEPKLNFE